MKKLIAVCLLLAAALPAVAVEGDQVLYVGGTIPGLNAGVLGRIDTTSSATLIFEHAGGKVATPYADITSYEYSKDVTHHLGVLPAIAVGLLKMRRYGHFFRYHVSRSRRRVPDHRLRSAQGHASRSRSCARCARSAYPCNHVLIRMQSSLRTSGSLPADVQ